MSESSNVKRRIGLIAGLAFAATLASCAIVPGPHGFPHIVDLTISGGGHHAHGHHRGHGHWRRGHRRGGGHHRHHRRWRHGH